MLFANEIVSTKELEKYTNEHHKQVVTADSSADQTLAYASASGAAAAAQAYFSATLTATTPEVRKLFAEYSSQALMGREALLGLMIQKGWANPYDEPTQQLQSVVSQA